MVGAGGGEGERDGSSSCSPVVVTSVTSVVAAAAVVPSMKVEVRGCIIVSPSSKPPRCLLPLFSSKQPLQRQLSSSRVASSPMIWQKERNKLYILTLIVGLIAYQNMRFLCLGQPYGGCQRLSPPFWGKKNCFNKQ